VDGGKQAGVGLLEWLEAEHLGTNVRSIYPAQAMISASIMSKGFLFSDSLFTLPCISTLI
jgi:hypothetical protein